MASNGDGDSAQTKRLALKQQTLDDAYAAPANFLEIDVVNPETHGMANKRYTDYEVRMRVRRGGCGWLVYCREIRTCTLPLRKGNIAVG